MTKAYNISALAKLSTHNNTTEFAARMRKAGINPIRSYETPNKTIYLWGQNAYDFAIKVREGAAARRAAAIQAAQEASRPAPADTSSAEPAPILNVPAYFNKLMDRLDEQSRQIADLHALTSKLVSDLGGLDNLGESEPAAPAVRQ